MPLTDERHRSRRERLLTALVLGAGLWPYRRQATTSGFWLMAVALALGALATFILVVAGFLEGRGGVCGTVGG
jgi:hypothetical protein